MKKAIVATLILLLGLFSSAGQIRAQEPVVQAILFYSPTCPHCHDVIDDVLPPLKAQYGARLQLVGIDTSKASGQALFEAALAQYGGGARPGVPALLVGDVYLVGAEEIPARFPGLIEEGLADGGVPWPALPGLRQAIPDLPPDAGTAAGVVAPNPTASNAISEDVLAGEASVVREQPSGLALAYVVLGGLILTLLYVGWQWFGSQANPLDPHEQAAQLSSWPIPLLATAGLIVALYLAYVEVTQSTAVCGPVGDCNAVQASPYALLLGVPIAVLGVIGYLAMLALWAAIRRAPSRALPWAAAGLALLALVSVLFSVYLTALEIFVIDAVCAWCLSSAVISAALLLVVSNALRPCQPHSPRRAPVQT